MQLILLGTTGYHPNERRHTSCLMLPEPGIVLDAGTGLFRARDELATTSLDVFLTHAHLDHVVGLTYLFDVLFEKGVERVTVHGEPDKLAAVREHLLFELLFPVSPPCEFRPLEPDLRLATGCRLRHFPLEHPGGAVGFRLDWPDRSMAFVTDTVADPNAPYVEAIRGVDLLVHECYFIDELAEWATKTGHSHATPVGKVAAKAGVGRLVLVHMNPLAPHHEPELLETVRKGFKAAELGEDGMRIEF